MITLDQATILSLADFAAEKTGLYEKFKTGMRKLASLAQFGTVRLLVIGAGGVGKSTLGSFLAGSLQEGPTSANYEKSTMTEPYRLKSELWDGGINVIPGQPLHEGTAWVKEYQNLATGHFRGVINVVSYGAHSMRTVPFIEHTLYQTGMSASEFAAAYQAERRAEEIRVLEQFLPHLKAAKRPFWLITLVTKQDIWWERRQEVSAHYEDATYMNLIDEIKQAKGEQSFIHHFASVSHLRKNFTDGEGNLLAPIAAGFEDSIQLAHQVNLSRLIVNLSKQMA